MYSKETKAFLGFLFLLNSEYAEVLLPYSLRDTIPGELLLASARFFYRRWPILTDPFKVFLFAIV
tara:strand:- start:1623 stop:1817 length:195 start_codon:yes stop_codon:yes gene_type:complete